MNTYRLEDIVIKEDNQEDVKEILRLLPEDTFRYTEQFMKGHLGYGEQYCGQLGIYAKKASIHGEKSIMLVVVNEHLFGDPGSLEDNPFLKVPDGAENIEVVPPRQSPLKKDHPFAGVQFDYKGACFFFGYELSEAAYETMCKGIVREQTEHAK